MRVHEALGVLCRSHDGRPVSVGHLYRAVCGCPGLPTKSPNLRASGTVAPCRTPPEQDRTTHNARLKSNRASIGSALGTEVSCCPVAESRRINTFCYSSRRHFSRRSPTLRCRPASGSSLELERGGASGPKPHMSFQRPCPRRTCLDRSNETTNFSVHMKAIGHLRSLML